MHSDSYMYGLCLCLSERVKTCDYFMSVTAEVHIKGFFFHSMRFSVTKLWPYELGINSFYNYTK